MRTQKITERKLKAYRKHLQEAEKSPLTIEKYMRDVRKFQAFAQAEPLTKALCTAYKKHLAKEGYAPCSINSMLASLNSLLSFLGLADCRVKQLKIQKQTYCGSDVLLTRQEYLSLLKAARGSQLHLIMQTMAGTGIRVSELSAFTVEELKKGSVRISSKGKTRTVFVPTKLRRQLLDYAEENRIRTGPVFLNSKGDAVSRSTVWKQMKHLCKAAGVAASKVFPHNLRKLFARTFYTMNHDMAKLADILGHYSMETTRIYIMETGEEHRRKIEKMGLVVPC